MGTRFDIRMAWFRHLTLGGPMIDPCLGVHQLENADALEIRDGALAGEHSLECDCIDDSMRREPAAKKPVANRRAEMVE